MQVATVSHIVHPGPGDGTTVVECVHTDWQALLAEVQKKVALLQHKVDAGQHLQRVADDYGMLTRKPFLGYRHFVLHHDLCFLPNSGPFL